MCMNKKRREILSSVVDRLQECYDIVDRISDDEQDSLENTPENLRESEKYAKMEDAADNLSDAADQIEYAIEHIELACEA